MRKIVFLLVLIFTCFNVQAQVQKHRLFVLTDIGNEPDDTQTMVRLLLYSNVIDIEGLAASTSTHMKHNVNPQILNQLITAYGKVRPNLLKHQEGYPTEEYLKSIVKRGPAVYGMEAVGKKKDSEASEFLIKCLEKDDPRPLWISAWGGTNILAQALYKLKDKKSKKQLEKLVAKLRVYTISDQDDAGCWIRTNFPDLFYICSPVNYVQSTWLGFNREVKGINNETISYEWLRDNIMQGHGPLGALYPEVSFGMEGDTPSWLNLIPNGLNNPEHPNWGGWGGRYELGTPNVDLSTIHDGVEHTPETRPIWTDTQDTYKPYDNKKSFFVQMRDTTKFTSHFATIFRWRDETQNDFAGRMLWCTKSFEEANHNPVPVLNIPDELVVYGGDVMELDCSNSYDPDGDALSAYWFQYTEAGTCKESLLGTHAPNQKYMHDVVVPDVKEACTIHLILRLTDMGTPAMTSYKRVIFNVLPASSRGKKK